MVECYPSIFSTCEARQLLKVTVLVCENKFLHKLGMLFLYEITQLNPLKLMYVTGVPIYHCGNLASLIRHNYSIKLKWTQ